MWQRQVMLRGRSLFDSIEPNILKSSTLVTSIHVLFFGASQIPCLSMASSTYSPDPSIKDLSIALEPRGSSGMSSRREGKTQEGKKKPTKQKNLCQRAQQDRLGAKSSTAEDAAMQVCPEDNRNQLSYYLHTFYLLSYFFPPSFPFPSLPLSFLLPSPSFLIPHLFFFLSFLSLTEFHREL